jgi:leucyl/phenylalanyl-tRNA--protein transferase
MNELGYAHSIECWNDNNLIGGLYGITIGSCFFGESMFSKITNASKQCLLFLVSILIKYDYLLLDSQFYNPHLVQFGAYEISDQDYQNKLKIALAKKNVFPTKINYSESVSILQSLTQTS